MNAAEMLERVCADAWPPLRQDRLGGWRLRWANGFTGRANSALAVGDPGVPISDALRTVCEFAHSMGILPALQVVHGSRVEAAITAAGWVENSTRPGGHEVSVLLGPLGRDTRAAILATPIPAWWELIAGSTEPSEAQWHVLTSGTVGFGVVDVDGAAAGAVRAAVVGEFLHIARLAISPRYRRRGLAAALVGSAGSWARERGASHAVLQVAVTNTPAQALYRALGYAEHHRYRYWVPPPATCEDRKS